MKYRGIFEYEYPTEHKPPVSIDVYLHGDCVKGKIIEWEYRQLEQESTTKNDLGVDTDKLLETCEKMSFDFELFGRPTKALLLDAVKNIVNDLLPATPQEPKPMVEIDLYSVIKQKYIEREVLDKIREQMKDYLRGVEITLEVLVENDPLRPKMEGAKDTLEECLELIDKAETEE